MARRRFPASWILLAVAGASLVLALPSLDLPSVVCLSAYALVLLAGACRGGELASTPPGPGAVVRALLVWGLPCLGLGVLQALLDPGPGDLPPARQAPGWGWWLPVTLHGAACLLFAWTGGRRGRAAGAARENALAWGLLGVTLAVASTFAPVEFLSDDLGTRSVLEGRGYFGFVIGASFLLLGAGGFLVTRSDPTH